MCSISPPPPRKIFMEMAYHQSNQKCKEGRKLLYIIFSKGFLAVKGMGDEVWIIFKIIFPWRVINYIANFPGERGLKHYHFWGEIFLRGNTTIQAMLRGHLSVRFSLHISWSLGKKDWQQLDDLRIWMMNLVASKETDQLAYPNFVNLILLLL